MRQARQFLPEGYYHILYRGTGNSDIFIYRRDYKKFLEGLRKYRRKYGIKILAFVLMPNHLHLLLYQNSPGFLSKFLHSLATSYAGYFNKKHTRKGHLFQDRFKHIIVDSDEYLTHLSRYIHLNPSSAKIVRKPQEYEWSSYKLYLEEEESDLVDKKTILSYFSKKNPTKNYKEFVESRLEYQQDISIQKLFIE